MFAWPIAGILMTGPTMSAELLPAGHEEAASVQSDRSSQPTSALSQFIVAHLPLTDRFEADRKTWKFEVPSELIAASFHIARFPESEEKINIRQLNDALRGCSLSNRMNANNVSITVHYDCARGERARIVYNFSEGRLERVLVGDIPKVLRCGICVDGASN